MPFDLKSLDGMLVCPRSRSALVQDGDSLVCTDPDCRLRFSIRDDIPIMLVDDAVELSEDSWTAAIDQNPPTAQDAL